MAKQMWSLFVAAVVLVSVTPARGQVAVLPLMDEKDPIKLSDAAFDATDPDRPAITVRLENTTAEPLATDRIWLSFLRFYTPEETRRNGDRVIWNCGLMTRANNDQPMQVIQPGASLPIRITLGQAGCALNPQHEHFVIGVSRITAGKRLADDTWKREPADRSRLLRAAMTIAR